METWLDPVVGSLDHLRVVGIRLLGPVGRTLVVRRELRVAVNGLLGVLSALLLTMGFATWSIAFAPLILGVPHLLADVRYLVVRPGLHRRPALWVAIGVPLVALLVTGDPRYGLLGLPGAALASTASWGRKVAGVFLGIAAVGLAVWAGRFDTSMLMAHGHNIVAMGIFLLWRRRETHWHWAPVVGFFVVYLGFLLGGIPFVPLAGDPGGQDLRFHLSWYAPGVAAPWGERLVLSFAFAQSVHYGLWLRLVPDEEQRRSTTRTVRRTLRDLVADLGAPLTVAVAGLGVAIAAWGLLDPLSARLGYLDLALVHGYLELSVLMLWLLEPAPEDRGRRAVGAGAEFA